MLLYELSYLRTSPESSYYKKYAYTIFLRLWYFLQVICKKGKIILQDYQKSNQNVSMRN